MKYIFVKTVSGNLMMIFIDTISYVFQGGPEDNTCVIELKTGSAFSIKNSLIQVMGAIEEGRAIV